MSRLFFVWGLICFTASASMAEHPANQSTREPAMSSQANAHQFQFIGMDGEPIALSAYRGKVMMVVNTASKCGFTGQYAELQSLQERFGDQGLVILGVPSADFGGQEFADESAVRSFVDEKFSITFPLTEISHVKGEQAHPFYAWANDKAGFLGSPKWNFHKYIIGKNGEFVTSYASMTSPVSNRVIKRIEQELAK